MTEQQKKQIRKALEGWFATSFWVDVHYGLAALGTLVVIVVYVVARHFDVTFGGFVASMWVTAVGNDKINMPPTPPTQ